MFVVTFFVIEKNTPIIIAGPCSAESFEQMQASALRLSALPQVAMVRCGVWKPRTHPGGFEGRGEDALRWIALLHEQMPSLQFCCEVASPLHVEQALRYGINGVWIGARTTVSPFAVGEVAQALQGVPIPVLVKNPAVPDVGLWLGSIERMQRANVQQVIAVHRGFVTYNSVGLRNNPLWEVAFELRRRRGDVPMLCDPSHIAGQRAKVPHLATMALDMGFDGLMIEAHPNPDTAITDAAQQIDFDTLQCLLQSLRSHQNDDSSAQEMLASLRTQIDEVDSQLLLLLAQRMDISRRIGDIKRRNDMTAFQGKRWEYVVKRLDALARQYSLDPAFVKGLFEKVHVESVRVQVEKNRNES